MNVCSRIACDSRVASYGEAPRPVAPKGLLEEPAAAFAYGFSGVEA
jgi:hypothetical protein